MESTVVPGEDPELVRRLEEDGETDELREAAEQTLEEPLAETNSYHISYQKRNSKTRNQKGTFYDPEVVESTYAGPDPELHVPVETAIEKFYVNYETGDFLLEDDEENQRRYRLAFTCDEGMILKGELPIGDGNETLLRYIRGDDPEEEEPNQQGEPNQLFVRIDSEWELYGEARKIGEGNPAMKHVELIENVCRALVPSPRSHEDPNRITAVDYDPEDASRELKQVDQALARCSDQSVNSIPRFEQKEEVKIDDQDHPFDNHNGRSTNGAKGADAAHRISHKFERLWRANIVDYKVSVGDGGSVTPVEINSDISDSGIRTISDITGPGQLDQKTVERIVDERFEG